MDSNWPDAFPALQPEDYYYEGSSMVFTAAYHLKRGYCCGSGCRHCPYRGPEASPNVGAEVSPDAAPARDTAPPPNEDAPAGDVPPLAG